MNKYKFIYGDKIVSSNLLKLSFENGTLNISLRQEQLKLDDGILLCSNCGYEIGKKSNIKNCPDCNQKLQWNLKKRYEEQNRIEILKNLLEPPLFDTSYTSEQIDDAINLLTKNQKQQLLSYQFHLLSKTNQIVVNLRKKLEDFDTKIVAEIIKINTKIGEHVNETGINEKILNLENKINRIDNSTITLEEKFNKIIKFIEEKGIKVDDSFKTQEDKEEEEKRELELRKIKMTLNIMIELFSKGMDLDAILLKAKVDMGQINYSSTVNFNNYNLDNDNEGRYLGQGIGTQIFRRFL